MGALVRLERVIKRYGDGPSAYTALRGVSLEIEAGELVSVIGPSGSGKTTLLNLIACLDVPTAGRVLLRDQDVALLSEAQRSRVRLATIGIVFQSFQLFPALTAAENVAWPLELAGESRSVIRTTVRDLLDQVGMADRAGRTPAELSGGEQQRVAIARALACKPSLILADEPTGNLDEANGQRILDLLERLCRERGATVVMVTHRTDAKRALFDRVVEIRDGQIHRDSRLQVSAA